MNNTIKIPLRIESRNVIDKWHWSQKQRRRKEYQVFIRQQMSHHRIKPASQDSKYNLLIATFRKRLILDPDNIDGGAKQLIDALVHESFIWDDSSKYVNPPVILQDKTTEEEHTIITRTPA